MYRFNADASAAAHEALGMAAHRIGGGVLTLVRNDPTGGYWSKAVALGITEPLTTDIVDQVIELATAHGVPAVTFQVAPHAEPPHHARLLDQRGGTAGTAFVKFFGPLATAADRTDLHTDLDVRPLGPEHAAAYGRVIRTGFGMPEDPAMEAWFAEAPTYGGDWWTVGAWDGTELVAVANLFVRGDVAALSGAATVPAARGRGAQGALMAARLREGASRGCRWVSTETWPESPGNPNPSQHNMRRLGLTQLYLRPAWVFRPPVTSP